jgi:uncharacterized protein YecT (DUF1311 family)
MFQFLYKSLPCVRRKTGYSRQMSHVRLLLLIVTVSAGALFSQPLPSPEDVDAALGTCAKNPSQEPCMTKYYGVLEGQRQQILNDLRTAWQRPVRQPAGNPTVIDLLGKSESTWVEFRNDSCEFEARTLGTGATSAIARIRCRILMTAERARYLQRFIDTQRHGSGLRLHVRSAS